MSLQFNSYFEKSCVVTYDPAQRKRVLVCQPLYSSEQWAALEAALSAAMGADFISFSWQEQATKQSFTLVFNGDFDPEIEMETPDIKLPIIDSTIATWMAEQG